MDLSYTDEEQAFRAEVRDWLAETLPRDLSEKVRLGKRMSKQDVEHWHRLLNAKGWLAPNWPKKYGGAEWNAVQRQIFEEEACLAHAPRTLPFGLSMLAPVLMAFGSEEQRQRFLPGLLDGTNWWCQGYSEPGAGSDLAAVKTRAVREGDEYVVNGQKTWTTLGQHADWIFCLVRTDPDAKKQEGISFLLIDMTSPGVTVRPIVLIDGEAEVNEVFFDNVRVPAENLVGEENKGWTYAKYLLTHERTNIAGVGFSTAALDTVKHVAQNVKSGGKPLAENPHFAARLAQVEIDLMAMATTNLRVVSAAAKGEAPGAESSMLKVKGTVIRQELTSLLRRAVGPDALPFQPDYLEGGDNAEMMGPEHAATSGPSYFNMRKLSIFGGSNEVQRTIITKAIIGL
ncbi:acyl-CoA dehydrogenase family protein [Shimia thalassica]|uniref:acyl-CoA dehydrogenase family protein n=1 Tax=Shimia thalassica TaxID=1715693 RepID=UPI000C08296B|nr:acyl-CoA dehydrogenase family protein [Shimia thalassica]PHO05713.1 pimeloyl-CoA dehydrogenase large subunit [Rhodobacteraceae bacterium 4F10]MBU2944805.1 acyl-CoA dehydrogenase family protein [Shimia thalassica]MDO6480745.1 acyl-CoA dehydrogenase family protein [Shimia thalassica]MDO6485079.1 acyl-CoA dehydrogenase family protein [Shimia thalassica]MDO6504890.1 acyl-CoA dehydrogenase family protein [Shimia thalassica]